MHMDRVCIRTTRERECLHRIQLIPLASGESVHLLEHRHTLKHRIEFVRLEKCRFNILAFIIF